MRNNTFLILSASALALGLRAREVAASVPRGRWGDPREIDGLARYLASEASSYMASMVLALDDGKLLW